MANERRLIDANALPVTTLTDGGYWTKDVVYKSDINAAPTVDAVEVVRCGECTQWDEDKLYCHHPAGLSYCGQAAAEKGFCCFGERRDD